MGLFSRTETVDSSRQGTLHNALVIAFDHVRNDFHKVSQWLQHLHQKNQQYDANFAEVQQRLHTIEQTMQHVPKSREEIKHIVDSYYSYENIHKKIEELNARMALLEQSKKAVTREEVRVERTSNLKERIVNKITKNSKEYIKSAIMGMIKKYHSISGPQLKEIIVEEQGLCSKSSFYRMLEELEHENELSVMQKGKEKLYILKSPIQH